MRLSWAWLISLPLRKLTDFIAWLWSLKPQWTDGKAASANGGDMFKRK
jgi:hypothetical protein